MRKALAELITLDDLTEDLKIMADVIGIEAVRKLLVELPGEHVYIPSPQRLQRFVRRYVRERFHVESSGRTNAREIAKDLGITRTSVRNYLRRHSTGANTEDTQRVEFHRV